MKAVNLLPSDHRGPAKAPSAAKTAAPKGDSFAAYVVLGALSLAVVATAAYVLTTNTIKDRKAELTKVRAETQLVQAKASALQGYADFQRLATARASTVHGLASSRFDWENSLRDLARALPRDVHLSSLKGTTSSATGSASPLRSTVQAPAIELTGCTTSQSGVARLMARLRAVRGVTRVSLAKSDKGETAAGAPGGTVGRLCRTRSAPKFELVVLFERAAVPATALPNGAPAQPGATTAPTAPGTTPPATTAPGTAPAPGATPAPGAAPPPTTPAAATTPAPATSGAPTEPTGTTGVTTP